MNISLNGISDEKGKAILSKNKISLTTDEFRILEKATGRPFTKVEAVIFSIQGSEHASYKSSRKYLSKFKTDGKDVILGPSEDAGIVKVFEENGEVYCVALGHESHNHPSQIVPIEGSSTGVGGIVRDIVCMGAKVVGVLDSLRFGNEKKQKTKKIFSGVTNGISKYANPIGVPNLGGDLFFDDSYDKNCLVNVACLGVLRKSDIIHSYVPENAKNQDYDFIIIGKATDFSGFGGASFASKKLKKTDKEENKGAVQESNAFLKRHLMSASYDFFKILKKKNMLDKVGFKDCGAGGLMCATVELADSSGFSAEINLDSVPTGEDDIPPEVIACAETQERFIWVVPSDFSEKVLSHYNEKWEMGEISQNAVAKIIGKVKNDGRYILHHNKKKVCDLDINLVTKGLSYDRKVEKRDDNFSEPKIEEIDNMIKVF